ERDGHAVATFVLLAAAERLDRGVVREVRADGLAQRAGAVAGHDDRDVSAREQALVEEAIDSRDGLVGALAANVDRRVDRARRRGATRGKPIDEEYRWPLWLATPGQWH